MHHLIRHGNQPWARWSAHTSVTLPRPPALAVLALWSLCVLGLPGAHAQGPSLDVASQYQEAWTTYHVEYRPEQALDLVQALLSRADLLPEDRIRGLLLAAICQTALGQHLTARQTLVEILSIDPDYRMSPRHVPPRLWQTYYELLRAQGRLSLKEGLRTLAILDLRNNSVTDRAQMEGLGQAIADMMIGSLAGRTDMRIVERERIEFVRSEVGLQQTEAFDRESAVRVGRLLGAQSLLLGGFVRLEDRIRIDVRLVRTETGEILQTHEVTGDFEDLFELLHSLGEDVCSDLGAVLSMPPDRRDADFGAFLEYSHGLVMLKMERLPEALAHFEAALHLDEDFVEARERVQQLAPLLAGASGRPD